MNAASFSDTSAAKDAANLSRSGPEAEPTYTLQASQQPPGRDQRRLRWSR
jgi:hypothetical protein